jgi:hypothetical protein
MNMLMMNSQGGHMKLVNPSLIKQLSHVAIHLLSIHTLEEIYSIIVAMFELNHSTLYT